MRAVTTAVILVLTLGVAACLVTTTRHTVYLEPDGAVTWTVLEEDVHSDTRAVAEREVEECQWLAAARAGDHGVARALAALGAEPTTRVLRDRRPFVAWTEARFGSVGEVIHHLVDGLELPATIEVDDGPDGGGFVVELDLAAAEDLGEADSDEPLFDLFDGLETAEVVLVEGRFTAADGFSLDDDGRVARPVEPPAEVVEAKQGTLRWELRWRYAAADGDTPDGASRGAPGGSQ